MSNLAKALAVCSALLPFGALAQQQTVIYDNSTTDLNQTYFGGDGVEFGDQITFQPGTPRTVVDFRFEYFLGSNASGNEQLQLVLRANNGPVISVAAPGGGTRQVATPGTVLYTSPVLQMQTGFQTAEASGFSIPNAPNTLTWTVTMTGIANTEVAGLILRDPPAVGSSFADFWQNNNGTWNTYLLDNGNTPANFAARVYAVPEPTTFALALVGGLGWLGFIGYRRRNS